MREFAGRTAFVTGGASGIGLDARAALASFDDRVRFLELDVTDRSAYAATADEAGETVPRGVRDNALYVFTAPEFRRGVEERFDAIRRALGEDPAREATALELIPGLVGSPIYREP